MSLILVFEVLNSVSAVNDFSVFLLCFSECQVILHRMMDFTVGDTAMTRTQIMTWEVVNLDKTRKHSIGLKVLKTK
jgi:hypothetical protein